MQSYKDIGELLARARDDRRMTIAEVSAALHIRPRYLQALEAGDIALMPGLPYAKGYLTRYASYLSLDLLEILRRFDMAASAANTPHFFMPHHFSHEKHIDLGTALKCTVIALLLLLVWALWIRPEHGALPMVDSLPQKVMEPEPASIPVKTVQTAPCLRSQNGLYPPCYWPEPAPQPSVMTIVRP